MMTVLVRIALSPPGLVLCTLVGSTGLCPLVRDAAEVLLRLPLLLIDLRLADYHPLRNECTSSRHDLWLRCLRYVRAALSHCWSARVKILARHRCCCARNLNIAEAQ